ncbi:putative arabinosyltransferase ARAD1 [Salvia divinorum]|uniref:Arabinosyltransferase ARAD1 n=1 Tax=Salvia divinorum TaxID=28513 RepID=A0ABD1GBX3_SALDI
MYLSQEKSIMPSRLLACLIAFAIFLLFSSSLSLIQFVPNSFIPMSVLHLILVNNTSISPTPTAKPNLVALPTPNAKAPTSLIDKSTTKRCDKDRALLRVYMYDLPPEFHFGLLGWKGVKANQTWPSLPGAKRLPSYPGGLNLQHSVEYWLTLDLLASNDGNVARPCSAYRVKNSSDADVIFVPFFSSLSYNRGSKQRRHGRQNDMVLQGKLVEFLQGRLEWKVSGGRDHLVVAHHPNSMLFARKKLGTSMFVLSDFGRYDTKIANIDKDVIAPYKHMVRTIPPAASASFDQRPTLVYFQGAIYRKDGGVIRRELYYLLKDESDVHFAFGSVGRNGVSNAGKGMASSKFCLNIAGDTPSSNRLFDAIASHCVPVIISDEIELPFEDVLDYSEFCVFVPAADAVKKGFLLNLLRGIKEEEWTKMWGKLKEKSLHYEYQYPSQSNDAVDMIWKTVARKKMPTRLKDHRRNRYSRSRLKDE